jgi:tricorn protease
MRVDLAFRWVAGLVLAGLPAGVWAATAGDGGRKGFYRDPAVHGETVVFTSEGDLWTVGVQGGVAHRLTSNAGTERMATISPDGQTVAFAAEYEGPTEVYTIPLVGGLPARKTWDDGAAPVGWTPDGRIVIVTGRHAALPDERLELVGAHGEREILPLATGSEAAYGAGGTLFFTRFGKQWSNTKRYKGGWVQTIWKFDGHGEAVPLTADWKGTSHDPMVWGGRLYFLSDRDGVMNVWSMDEAGHDLKQESHQKGFDIESATVSDGRIVYACGADLWTLDLKTGHEAAIPITLESDFDQLREHWVKTPGKYVSDAHISPDGSSVVVTSRGAVFTLPAKSGRIVKVAGDSAVRFRSARFLPDGKNVVALSTQTGETEFWKYPANGVGKPEQWTNDAKVLRWDGVPSPDGRWLAHWDKDQQLWLFDTKTKVDKKIAQSMVGDFSDVSWSGDSRWLAFGENAANEFTQIKVLRVDTGAIETLTSDRYNSVSPVWSTDGKWLYFLSDRMLKTTVSAPWGPREPEPHFDRPMKVYQLGLSKGHRSPFLPADELHPAEGKDLSQTDEDKNKDKVEDKAVAAAPPTAAEAKKDDAVGAKKDDAKKEDEKKIPEVKIDFDRIAERLEELPVPPGNYSGMQGTEKRLCWLNSTDEAQPKNSLQCLDIDNKGEEADTVLRDVKGFEISQDRKKILIARDSGLYVVDSDAKGAGLDGGALGKVQIDTSRWQFSTTPRDEFRGYFEDAWRLERDYFYDKHMQGVDWPAMKTRYLPLVDRVSDRDELNDVIAQMVSELSALHTFVQGGDMRSSPDQIDLATLGAELERDEKAGGYVVKHVYAHDPDLPDQAPPLARPESRVREGEVVVSIDGTDLLSVPDERALLRGKAGTQVLLRVKSKTGELRSVLVKPMSAAAEDNLRYAEWEYTRRQTVEKDSAGKVGYVHLRAMGSGDMDEWARDYYPVFDRQGLIIDVRHNEGGNIDSWLLSKLLRQAWFYFQPRVGSPSWNMQDAFRGHIVVLCDEHTASDGEAFSAGFQHFKMGPVIGTRTWGGEIWLSGANVQADGGVATAAEIGVYADGKWLIEGHGVDPDVVVDNLPHATYEGKDAQLEAAMALLKKEIAEDPRPVPAPPAYPDKSFRYR